MSCPAEQAEGEAGRLLRVTGELVRQTHPGRAAPVTLDSPLERELGLDSLARVELLLRLGREFGVTLPETALAEAETPRDLLRLLGYAAPAVADIHPPSDRIPVADSSIQLITVGSAGDAVDIGTKLGCPKVKREGDEDRLDPELVLFVEHPVDFDRLLVARERIGATSASDPWCPHRDRDLGSAMGVDRLPYLHV